MAGQASRPYIYLAVVAIIAIIVVAAVLATRQQVAPPEETATTPTQITKISFYTWWAGLERFAIDALIGNFTERTGISVEKTAVPGGAGVNAKFAIIALIMAGKPPAAFQVHCGPEIISYFAAAPNGADDFVDLTDVAKEIDITQTPPGQACMLSGKFYSLPVNLHRANLIFMNKELLDRYGIDPPRTLEELVAAAKKLKENGVPGMVQAGADLFTVLHLWEQIFLAVAGPEKFIEFMYGTLDPNDPSLREATEVFLELVDTFPDNWASLDWTSAVDVVVKGNGAFHVDGDWVVGLIYNVYPDTVMCPIDDVTPDCDIIVAPFPGTEGIYNMVIDAVAVPKGPEASAGVEFAKFFASREGQRIFNPLKGSIADYPDIPPDIYPTTIQKWEVEEYKRSRSQVFSLTHGALFSDVWQKLLQQAVVLAETKAVDLWYRTLTEALPAERQQWEASGFIMGTKENPFAGYLPPWASG
ncbi:MAG: ABC transporter substrate-binding protein [Desulfurococcales archaeon]|nr:ABC transporter substrate-binding protein [Desulfurococcales archaeon]